MAVGRRWPGAMAPGDVAQAAAAGPVAAEAAGWAQERVMAGGAEGTVAAPVAAAAMAGEEKAAVGKGAVAVKVGVTRGAARAAARAAVWAEEAEEARATARAMAGEAVTAAVARAASRVAVARAAAARAAVAVAAAVVTRVAVAVAKTSARASVEKAAARAAVMTAAVKLGVQLLPPAGTAESWTRVQVQVADRLMEAAAAAASMATAFALAAAHSGLLQYQQAPAAPLRSGVRYEKTWKVVAAWQNALPLAAAVLMAGWPVSSSPRASCIQHAIYLCLSTHDLPPRGMEFQQEVRGMLLLLCGRLFLGTDHFPGPKHMGATCPDRFRCRCRAGGVNRAKSWVRKWWDVKARRAAKDAP